MEAVTDHPYIAEELRHLAVPCADLHEDPDNVRVHDDRSLHAVKQSLDRFGQRTPIVARHGKVIAGNARLAAARALGWSHIAVVSADADDDNTALLYAIADNRTGDLSEFDMAGLAEVLGALKDDDIDMSALGWTDAELDEILDLDLDDIDGPNDQGSRQPEFEYTPPENPTTKPGDLITLGNHRLLCGDSTKSENVQRLMDGETARLMVTDPPYGVNYASDDLETMKARKQRTDGKTVANDELSGLALQEFLCEVFDVVALDPGAPWYVFGPTGDQYIHVWLALEASNLNPRHQLVWVKNWMVLGRSDYHKQHESIIYGWKPGAGHYFINDRTQTTVWEFPKPSRSDLHPTMKPVPMIEKCVKNSSRKNELVYDPFLGSGTTLIACENLRRRCYGMEIDPKYCDVIVERWEQATGDKAVRP